MARNEEFVRSQSLSRTGATNVFALRGLRWLSCINRSPSGNGSGLRRTALIAEKTALLAPIPRANVSTTVAVNAGVLASVLSARRRFAIVMVVNTHFEDEGYFRTDTRMRMAVGGAGED
jgi:hypothetical protein